MFKQIFIIFLAALFSLSACTSSEVSISQNDSTDKISETNIFDFKEFGRAHNDYLYYVQSTGIIDPKKRFEYGKTYVDSVFGSFDVGLDYETLNSNFPKHMEKVDRIMAGKYLAAKEENVNQSMSVFLDQLAMIAHKAVTSEQSKDDLIEAVKALTAEVAKKYPPEINLIKRSANDGAGMQAIAQIFIASIEFDSPLRRDGNEEKRGFFKKIRRALADSWGYVAAVEYIDGTILFDPQTALVNADCHSDRVYEN